ncbi:hypothetical protein, partial [Pseudorhodobacter sp.]|uniref:hypothetical protein n=1 Tax=Pseudorhodobacter sp. TaxID=1934400 RepID=UPI00264A1D0E
AANQHQRPNYPCTGCDDDNHSVTTDLVRERQTKGGYKRPALGFSIVGCGDRASIRTCPHVVA